jgi:hypothetical protein
MRLHDATGGLVDLAAVGQHVGHVRPVHLVLAHVVPAHFVHAYLENVVEVGVHGSWMRPETRNVLTKSWP